jgi:uncharacterized membrane protein
MNKGKLSLLIILLILISISIVPTIYITASMVSDQVQTVNKEAINTAENQGINDKIMIFYKYVFTPIIIMLGIVGILLPAIEILNKIGRI